MSKEAIIERILSDAEAEKAALIKDAQDRAEEILAAAKARTEKMREEAEAEISERAAKIREGKAASARLESAKIYLAQKRRVMDAVYLRALQALLSMDERRTLKLLNELLEKYAEEGDEVVFAQNFAFYEKAVELPIFSARKLKASSERMKLSGGCVLRGKNCDKDLTYGALLAQDRELYQSEIAQNLFRS